MPLDSTEERENQERKELKTLKAKREAIMKRLKRADAFIQEPSADTLLEEYQRRLEKARETWTEYEDVQTRIEELEEDQGIATHWTTFENLYYRVIPAFDRRISHLIKQEDSTTAESSLSQTRPSRSPQTKRRMDLPQIELPLFHGSFAQWQPFSNLFKSLVHRDESLSEVDKMHYLLLSLRGEALHTVESLEITDQNYSIAWNLLQTKYDNKREMIREHVQKLLTHGIMALVDAVLNSHKPAQWSPMARSSSLEVHLEELHKSSLEFITVQTKICSTLPVQVNRVQRVQNPYMYGCYLLKKEEYMKRYRNVTEKELFHATSSLNVSSITKQNLDWRLTVRSKFGKGVSFSPSAHYANLHCNRGNSLNRALFVTKVLVSATCAGNEHMTLPFADTSTGNNGNVYVKYYDNEFYPTYVAYYNSPPIGLPSGYRKSRFHRNWDDDSFWDDYNGHNDFFVDDLW